MLEIAGETADPRLARVIAASGIEASRHRAVYVDSRHFLGSVAWQDFKYIAFNRRGRQLGVYDSRLKADNVVRSEPCADIYGLFSGRSGIIRYVGETGHDYQWRFKQHRWAALMGSEARLSADSDDCGRGFRLNATTRSD